MTSPPLLLGHRGARAVKTVAENTLLAFDLALAHGCDGFEFDVRRSADSHAVVCHDPEIGGVQIASANAAQMSALPLLSDVLQRYRHAAFLDIELKEPGLETIAASLLRQYTPSRGYVVSSFLPEVLRALNRLDRALPLGLICDTKAQLAQWRGLPIAYLIPHQRLALRRLLREIHDGGKKVLVWTVNNSADMKRLAKWGADGIISDETEKLARTLRSGIRRQ